MKKDKNFILKTNFVKSELENASFDASDTELAELD